MPNFVCQSVISIHIFYMYYLLDQMNTANAFKKGFRYEDRTSGVF